MQTVQVSGYFRIEHNKGHKVTKQQSLSNVQITKKKIINNMLICAGH